MSENADCSRSPDFLRKVRNTLSCKCRYTKSGDFVYWQFSAETTGTIGLARLDNEDIRKWKY